MNKSQVSNLPDLLLDFPKRHKKQLQAITAKDSYTNESRQDVSP